MHIGESNKIHSHRICKHWKHCQTDKDAKHILIAKIAKRSTSSKRRRDTADAAATASALNIRDNEQYARGGDDPPLSLQLSPLTVKQLRDRLMQASTLLGADTVDAIRLAKPSSPSYVALPLARDGTRYLAESQATPHSGSSNTDDKSRLLRQLCAIYQQLDKTDGSNQNNTGRIYSHFRGSPLPVALVRQLRHALDRYPWRLVSPKRQRQRLRADQYVVVPRRALILTADPPVTTAVVECEQTSQSAAKQRAGRVHALAHAVMQWAAPDAAYTHVAITKNFVGSPHVDAYDVSYQHALCLGDFGGTGGAGSLCVETGGLAGREVCVVDTRNRIARVDGR